MLREELLRKTIAVLEEAGFEVAPQLSPSCFDILARREIILLVKVLANADSLYKEQAEDLRNVANVLGATPMVVAALLKSETIRPKTIYDRYGIKTISLGTFEEAVLDRQLPIVYAKRGGFFAHINPDYLKKVRAENKLSLGELSREAGISKKSLQDYEHGKGAEIENILRLQAALGDLVLNTVNIFQKKIEALGPAKPERSAISARLEQLGFKTTSVHHAAFRMISRHKEDILLTGLKTEAQPKKARDIHSTAETLGQHDMFVLEHAREKSVQGVPVLERKELEAVITSRELLRLLRELASENEV